jgi:integrase
MASLNARKETGKLVIDFRYQGQRCREQTALDDTPANRKRLQKLLEKLESEIGNGTFNYAQTFPGSKRVAKFATAPASPVAGALQQASVVSPVTAPRATHMPTAAALPTFSEFTATWVAENDIGWRRSHKRTVMDIINVHLVPAFGERVVSDITKADVLQFRSTLAKVPGRKAETLSAKRINAIAGVLRQILNEAADRFEFTTAYRNIKPLKVPRSDIVPFNLEQVQAILATVRADFRDYYTVRFFTGMRTGEIDGLKWKYIDFERRQILIRETIVAGEEDITKTDGSQREIQMSEIVYQALRRQEAATRKLSAFVFCNREGQPLDHVNVTKRVWYPLLRHLGFDLRRPYQTRHTAATLWLAAGENPQWIARQMGHTSTEMLFKVYARFVPNLTRQDGSAFERLLVQSGTVAPILPALPDPATEPPPTVETGTVPAPSSTSISSEKELDHV